MHRVVITGLGIVSPIGNNADEVLTSLKAGTSGIVASDEMAEHGFRSQIAGTVKLDIKDHVDKRALRFMGPGAAYAYIAMGQAIADAGLDDDTVSNVRTGLIAGSGGPSTSAMLAAHDVVKNTGATKRIGPFAVPKCMSSTISANLSTQYKIKGINYSITSACSTSLHCIGSAAEQIMMGKQDVMFAGGAEELDWTLSCLFDAMGAMSSKYNDTPEKASRAFDADRDGFVIAGGGAMLVLESLEHAQARGAKIYAEVTGFAATSDGHDMVAPSGEGGNASGTRQPACGSQNQLYQRTWHIDASGRRRRDRGRPPCVRPRVHATRVIHKIHDGPQPRGDRCIRGRLLSADAGKRLHRAVDQRGEFGPEPRPCGNRNRDEGGRWA